MKTILLFIALFISLSLKAEIKTYYFNGKDFDTIQSKNTKFIVYINQGHNLDYNIHYQYIYLYDRKLGEKQFFALSDYLGNMGEYITKVKVIKPYELVSGEKTQETGYEIMIGDIYQDPIDILSLLNKIKSLYAN
jgi:hypothetical protein